MKKIILFFFILILPNNSLSNIEGKIILKVNNEIITEYEIKNKILITLFLSQQEINQENINKLKKQTLNSLISLKLKKIEVDKKDIQVPDTQILKYLNQISSNNLVKFKNDFKFYDLDFDLYSEEIKTEIRWQKLITQIYSKKIDISETEINNQLKNILENKSKIQFYRLSEIEINNTNINQNKKLISDLKNEINNTNFETAALKFSIASSANKKGDIGWISGEVLSKQMYNIVSKMSINEISEPIIRQDSIIFLKLTGKKTTPQNNINQNDLRKNLINQKKNQLFNLYSRSHLSKIRNNSLIESK